MCSTVQPPKPRPNIPPPSERKIEVKVPISIKDYSQETGIKEVAEGLIPAGFSPLEADDIIHI